MDATSAEFHYVEIVFPVVSVLYQECLVLGIFFVAWGQIRHLMREPAAARHGDFWRRIIILISILLYIWMTTISYSLIKAEARPEGTVNPVLFTAWTLVMVPIEVLSVLVVAGLFAAIALPDFKDEDKLKTHDDRNLAVELAISFALACALHVLYFFWWLMLALFTGGVFAGFSAGLTESPVDQPFVFNGGYHLLFAAVNCGLFLWWKKVTAADKYQVFSSRRDWQGALLYSGVLVTVYVTRFGHYLLNYPGLASSG